MRSILIIILLAGIANADNRIKSDNLVVVIVNKEECKLSRYAEKLLQSTYITNELNQNHQQVFIYNAQDHMKYTKSLGTTHLPTLYYMKKIDGKWYKYRTFDPQKRKFTLQNILNFLRPRNLVRMRPGSS